jgi:beta-aspartyl-dipeptidase (metallo-type)
MRSIREDMLFVDEVVGAGEVAISDERGLNQSAQELAKLVRDTHVGGLLSGKAGITHLHVGEEETRLQPLREIIEDFQVKPESLYPTHVQRNARLLREAIDLANAGAHVDFDVVNEDLAKWLGFFIENGGPLDKLTISSDTDSTTPDIYWEQICSLVVRHGYTLDYVLPLVTTNPARVLKLDKKGRLEVGKDADIVILSRDSLEIRDVIARGKRMVADGEPVVREKFLSKSSRSIDLVGDKFNGHVATKA